MQCIKNSTGGVVKAKIRLQVLQSNTKDHNLHSTVVWNKPQLVNVSRDRSTVNAWIFPPLAVITALPSSLRSGIMKVIQW